MRWNEPFTFPELFHTQGEGLYLVKWEDWPSEFNTWEPLRNLVDCQDKLKEFYYHRLTERENAAPNR